MKYTHTSVLGFDGTDKEMSLEEARKILGKVAKNMSDEELRDQISMIQYLAESWLDDYEKSIFNGKTVNELINDMEQ